MRWHLWGSGEPLVLLHGGFGSWTHWLRNIEPLVRRFRVIVPEIPGYGASDMPPEPWSSERLAGILREGLAEIVPAPKRYGLAGFSFDGIIVGHLAALDGARVTKLLLLGPGGFALPGGTPGPLLRMKCASCPRPFGIRLRRAGSVIQRPPHQRAPSSAIASGTGDGHAISSPAFCGVAAVAAGTP